MSTDRIHYLLEQLFHHECSPEEKEELALWIDSLGNDEEWKTQLEKIWNEYQPDRQMDPTRAGTILDEILYQQPATEKPEKIRKIRFKHWRVAATIALLAGIGIFYLMRMSGSSAVRLANIPRKHEGGDIAPGGNKAMLTLANGTKIFLDSIQVGAKVGKLPAVKLASGILTYNPSSFQRAPSPGTEYNTITTPRGGQFQVILPDGSKVWLNAESWIKFPTMFRGDSRKIELSGEAYFEIAKDVTRPFIVGITSPKGRQEGLVKVLGTRFNINAYSDESAVKATLLEGSIRISGSHDSEVLTADEQAEFNNLDLITVIKNADINEAIAWKNGLFDFEGSDIEQVMRQVSRWYDVQVVYQNSTSPHFMGTISRNVNVSEVLKMLELTGAVHFEVEGRTITVLP